MPVLPLPDYRETLIVVGTTVRKSLPILSAYLRSLDRQELPPHTRLLPVFVPDFATDQHDARDYLFQWVNERGGTLRAGVEASTPDFADDGTLDSHQWSGSAMARVGEHKNRIIEFALSLKADYLFFADADLIMDTTTLRSLMEAQRPIATAVYWTHWTKRASETNPARSGPQVWLQHPYGMAGRGMDEAEFRAKLLNRGLHRVWGFGACTLINRSALESGVNFSYLPGVSTEGLMGGEDRHFCLRAERQHIEAFADCWPDIFHIYHADQHVARIPEFQHRLETPHPDRATLGDLVSLRLRPLEPIPVSPTTWQQPPTVPLRGRVGSLALLPEIEEAVYDLLRGQSTVVKAHFPTHHEVPYLRGRMRLIEVTLVDIKPYGFPPIVEDELFVGPRSGRWHDPATLTPPQQESLVHG